MESESYETQKEHGHILAEIWVHQGFSLFVMNAGREHRQCLNVDERQWDQDDRIQLYRSCWGEI